MISVDVNNGQKLALVDDTEADCLKLRKYDSKGVLIEACAVEYGEFVMLMNYFRNCKNGTEKSDYIK